MAKNEIKEIIDTALNFAGQEELKTSAQLVKTLGGRGPSMKAYAKKAIARFPIIVSDAVNDETKMILKNYFEHQYGMLLKIALEQEMVEEGSYEGQSPVNVLMHRYHSNMNLKKTIRENHDVFKLVQENESFKDQLAINCINTPLLDQAFYVNKDIAREMRLQVMESLNIKKVRTPLQEASIQDIIEKKYEALTEAPVGNSKSNRAFNEPLELEISLNVVGGDRAGNFRASIYILGEVYTVPSDEMMAVLVEPKDNSTLRKFLRNKATGVLQSLSGTKLKKDKMMKNKSFKLWQRLEGSKLFNAAKILASGVKTTASAHVVFEQGEINLAANQGYAYQNEKSLVSKLIRKYNIIQLAIVDETSGLIYAFDADDGRWNTSNKGALDQTYLKGEIHQMQKINAASGYRG